MSKDTQKIIRKNTPKDAVKDIKQNTDNDKVNDKKDTKQNTDNAKVNDKKDTPKDTKQNTDNAKVNDKKYATKDTKQNTDNVKNNDKKDTKMLISAEILKDKNKLKSVIEGIIYIEGTVSINRIFRITKIEKSQIRDILQEINDSYKKIGSAIRIKEAGESVIMSTSNQVFDMLAEVYEKKKKTKLSKSLLQTLAVIAYKQPITKAEIDDVRGSDSARYLKMLMDEGFVVWKGRKDILNKPQMFGTTDKFLLHFGISSLDNLPTLRELKDLEFNRHD